MHKPQRSARHRQRHRHRLRQRQRNRQRQSHTASSSSCNVAVPVQVALRCGGVPQVADSCWLAAVCLGPEVGLSLTEGVRGEREN
eukprot:15453731-Alexandrium_andersonii.AAC.1